MANLPGDGRIELIIKRYPGGRFSSLLDGEIKPGDELRFTGPYGAFHLRDSDRPDPDGRRRLRHGADPVAAAQPRERGQRRGRCASSTARAREQDLFYVDLVEELGARLPTSSSCPVIGFVHEPARASASRRARWTTPRSTCAARRR